jgi:hypothetical protein
MIRSLPAALLGSVLIVSTAAAQAPAEEPTSEAAQIRALEERLAAVEALLAEREADDQTAITAHSTAEETAEASDDAADRPAEEEEAPAPFTLGGWVEAYWAWNFNEPSNGITDLRGFDNRHNSFNLSNVALDAHWDYEGVNGRITLQWGSTPTTYYLAETAGPNLGTGVGAQSLSLWQFVQQAFAGYRIPIGNGLNVQAGLFLSPIGDEGMSVRDNWFYSRSNLFYGFPFYHTGIRLSYPIIPELTVYAWAINGWNTVLDNNDEKSILLTVSLTLPTLTANLTYLTGVERPRGAPEGTAWRHVFDLNATLTPIDWLGIQGQITGGWEPNAFGTSGYFAGALAVRVAPIEWLAVSARGDFFWERAASNGMGTASSIFWPVEWVSSATLSVELRPHDQVSFRIEYRHDQAAGATCDGSATQTCAYFRGAVSGDGLTMPFVRSASSQDTLTLGTTAWF